MKGRSLLVAGVSTGIILIAGIFFVALNLVMQQGRGPPLARLRRISRSNFTLATALGCPRRFS